MTTDPKTRARELVSKGNPWLAVKELLAEVKRLRELLAAKEQEVA